MTHRGVVSCVLMCVGLLAGSLVAEDVDRLLLVARGVDEKVLSGCRFAYQGSETLPTSSAGATNLQLPAKYAPGQPIKIFLLSGPAAGEEWFLVNPIVNVAASGSAVELVLMRRAEFRRMADAARDAFGQATRSGEEISKEQRRRILAEYAEQHGLTEEQLAETIAAFGDTEDPRDRGIAAYLAGEYARAEMNLLEAAENQEGDFAETLRYLGMSQYAQGKYSDAVATFRKAVAVRGDDAVLLGFLGWLALALNKVAKWDEAESLYRSVLAKNEVIYGPDHPNVARDLNNLAMLLKDTNRLSEAEPLMRRALAIAEASYGPDHPNVATSLNNLALLFQGTNRVSQAEPLFRRALVIDEASYGPGHPSVAGDLNNLAGLLEITNRLSEAELLYRRALIICEASLGEDYPHTQLVRRNLEALLSYIARHTPLPLPN